MKVEVKNIATAFMSSKYGKSDRGVYAKECLQEASKLPAAALVKSIGGIGQEQLGTVKLTIDGRHPIYDFKIVETVTGLIFKKKARTLVLIGADRVDDLGECASVADLAKYATDNGFAVTSLTDIVDVGIGTVDCSDGSFKEEVYFNYNVSSVDFNKDKMVLSFNTEDRIFT